MGEGTHAAAQPQNSLENQSEVPHPSFLTDPAKNFAKIPHPRIVYLQSTAMEHHNTPHPVHDYGLEAEIQAKASTAPRVTPADIEAEIVSEFYFTAADGVRGELLSSLPGLGVNFGGDNPLSLLTFCVLVLRNGFTVTGESACASPENFNAEIGRRIARENAVNKVWPLLGFRLRDRLAEG